MNNWAPFARPHFDRKVRSALKVNFGIIEEAFIFFGFRHLMVAKIYGRAGAKKRIAHDIDKLQISAK